MRGASSLLFVVWLSSAAARPGEAPVCGEATNRVAACTAYLESKTLTGEQRAAALIERGGARSDLPGAIADFEEALLLDPNNERAISKWTLALDDPSWDSCQMGREPADQRLAACSRHIDARSVSNGRRLIALKARADIYRLKKLDAKGNGDHASALADLEAALKINPRYADALMARAQIRSFERAPQEAIADYTAAVEAASHYPQKSASALVMRSLVHETWLRDKAKAIADLEAALKLDPNSSAKYRLSYLTGSKAEAQPRPASPPTTPEPRTMASLPKNLIESGATTPSPVAPSVPGTASPAIPPQQTPSATAQAPATALPPDYPPWRVNFRDYQIAGASEKYLTPNGPVDQPKIDGFKTYGNIVDAGFGTYFIAVPAKWDAWMIPMGPEAFLDRVRKIEPGWAEVFGPRLRTTIANRDKGTRGLFFSGSKEEMVFLELRYQGRHSVSHLAEWQKDPKPFNDKAFWDSVERFAWIDTASGKTLKVVTFSPDRTQANVTYDVAEMQNGTRWQLGCVTWTKLLTQQEPVCDRIASSFHAGAWVEAGRNAAR